MVAFHCQGAEANRGGLHAERCQLQKLLKIDGEIRVGHGGGTMWRLLLTEAEGGGDCEELEILQTRGLDGGEETGRGMALGTVAIGRRAERRR